MNLTDCITSPDNGGTWDFQCSYPDGCGEPGGGGFTSTGWPTAKSAKARGREHFDEHEKGTPMTDLDAFREANGIVVQDGNATLQDSKGATK